MNTGSHLMSIRTCLQREARKSECSCEDYTEYRRSHFLGREQLPCKAALSAQLSDPHTHSGSLSCHNYTQRTKLGATTCGQTQKWFWTHKVAHFPSVIHARALLLLPPLIWGHAGFCPPNLLLESCYFLTTWGCVTSWDLLLYITSLKSPLVLNLSHSKEEQFLLSPNFIGILQKGKADVALRPPFLKCSQVNTLSA